MNPEQRFSRAEPCPICGGYQGLPQGRGVRCWGYQDDTGRYARCTREERAGGLERNGDGTYSHRLDGPCGCGQQHGPETTSGPERMWIIRDPDGQVLAYHHRRDLPGGGKKFRWSSPGHPEGLNGLHPVDFLYGSEKLAQHPDAAVILTEGEKSADSLQSRCDPDKVVVVASVCGAASTLSRTALAYLAGRRVGLWPDSDPEGSDHMAGNGHGLRGLAESVRRVRWDDAPPHGDAADYCDTHTREQVAYLLHSAALFEEGVGVESAEPYARALTDFLGLDLQGSDPLIGSEEENLLPTGGLLLLIAKGGKGKTTFTIDAAFHLASGVEWLGFPVPRPLRVLVVENEGPMKPFQRKLAAKAKSWSPEITGAIFVKTIDWGTFSIDNDGEAARLRAFIEKEHIDLVIGDPLDSLGLHGVGSPEDTRAFVQRLVPVGLTGDVAFWLLGHPRKPGPGGAEDEDELDRASGSWGGRPDTMLLLAKLERNRARLSFPKIRWAPRQREEAFILAFDPESESFSHVGTEQPEPEDRDLLQEVAALLGDGRWRTSREMAAPREPKRKGVRPGIGARRESIEEVLTGNPDRFEHAVGKEAGRPRAKDVWRLREVAR